MSGPARFRGSVVSLLAFSIVVASHSGTKAATSPSMTRRSPLKRWWWAYEQRGYPWVEIPPGARMRAWREIEGLKYRQPGASPPRVAQTPAWAPIGPAPILNPPFGMVSGRVSAVAVDPASPNHWLVGAASGGIWESAAGGARKPRTDDQPPPSIGAIALSPSDPTFPY